MIINKNYQRCLKVIFDQTSSILEKNIYSFSFLSQEAIITLNLQGHNQLHKFYDAILNKYTIEDFPKFATEYELPKFVRSTSFTPIRNNFFIKAKKREPERQNFENNTEFSSQNFRSSTKDLNMNLQDSRG